MDKQFVDILNRFNTYGSDTDVCIKDAELVIKLLSPKPGSPDIELYRKGWVEFNTWFEKYKRILTRDQSTD